MQLVHAEDVLATCYLTCGKIAPDFEQLELSVGESTVAAAVVQTTGAVISTHSHAAACSSPYRGVFVFARLTCSALPL